jgi:hypothetical protein
LAGACGDPREEVGEAEIRACNPGEARACYTGPDGTSEVGACRTGVEVCNAEGTSFEPCAGQVTPGTEDCATPEDEDCDGEALDAADGCVCAPGSTAICYSGPAGSEGLGACRSGEHVCNAFGTGYGECTGEITPGAEVCGSPADESCDGEATCAGTHVWSKLFGDGSWHQEAGDVAIDASGNIVLTGSFGGELSFGGDPLVSGSNTDVFIAMLDRDGGHQWSKHFGGGQSQFHHRLAIDGAGGIVVAGGFAGVIDFGGGPMTTPNDYTPGMFVAKLDASGKHLWSKSFVSGDQGDTISDIAVDGDGNVVLTGNFYASIDFGGGPLTSEGGTDIFIAKLDAGGDHLWSKRFGGPKGHLANSVAVGAGDEIVLAGAFTNALDLGGGTLESAGGLDGFVAKLDPSGEHIWSKRFGDAANQSIFYVAADKDNKIVLSGFLTGAIDFGGGPLVGTGDADIVVAKLDASGEHVFSLSFGNGEPQSPPRVAVDAACHTILTGRYLGALDFGGGLLVSAGSFDVFLLKLDPSGAHVLSKRFGDSGSQVVEGAAADTDGGVVLLGHNNSAIDFGGGPLWSSWPDDMFVAKLGP